MSAARATPSTRACCQPTPTPRVSALVVDAAASTWQTARCDPSSGAPPGLALVGLPLQDSPIGYFPGQRNVNTVAFRDHWGDDAHHIAGTTAITVVTYDPTTGQILDADVELNLRSAANPAGYVFDAPGDPMSADLQTVLTHEFGHVQGLAHSADRTAVMWPAAGRTFAQQVLTPDDESAICAVAPSAPAVTCDPTASGDPRPVAPSTPGCNVVPSRPTRRDPRWVTLLVGFLLTRRARRSPR